MKKRVLSGFLVALSVLSLTGCGSNHSYDYSSSSNGIGFALDSDSASFSDVYYSSDYEYDTNTNISGDMSDYSYNIGLEGNVQRKETVLDFYEEVQAFVDEKEGYISSVNNNFSVVNVNESYLSKREKDNYAIGNASFTIQIDNQYVEEVTALFDTFCAENNFIILDYSQHITNYKDYDIVDSYDDNHWYRNYDDITQHDLDKSLKYSDISVNISYNIPRNFISKIAIYIKDIFSNIWDEFGELLNFVVLFALMSYVSLFVIAIPISKLFIRKISKYYKKHPDFRKTIVVETKDVTNKEVVATTNMDVATSTEEVQPKEEK